MAAEYKKEHLTRT